MKNILNGLSVFLLLFLFTGIAYALEVPKLKGYVNDYASMLSADEQQKLSRDLELYESSTSTQIFILTIPSLEGEVLENFSIKVAEAWKAGQQKKDNGVIILLSKNDRKIRIEVGRGLEGVITDLVSGRIIREEMSPRLKKGETYEALKVCVEKIQLAAKGEYKGNGKTSKEQGKEEDGKFYLALGIFFVITGIAGMVHFLIGGIIGAFLAPAIGMFMFHVALPTLIILAVIGFVAGLVGRVVLEAGLAGGSSGGGSFGGGGGSFGGGGASGSW